MIQFFLGFNQWAILFLRIVLGLLLIAHGWPKIKNFAEKSSGFENMGFKPGSFWVVVAIFTELVGGVAILVGFLTQIFAALIVIQFIILAFTVHKNDSLAGKRGWMLLMAAAAFMLVTTGSGILGVDSFLGVLIY